MLNELRIKLRNKGMQCFWREEDGAVAAIFGLMAIVMFLMVGGAVDFSRWLHARKHTIAAMDAAVLAGGRSLQTTGDAALAVAAAQTFYDQNTTSRLPLKTDNIEFAVANDGLSITSTGNATIDTPFLSLANINELPILDTNGAEYSKAEVAVGKNAGVNLEISLMLDVTGSMYGSSRIGALKTAAKDLIDIVVWDDQSEYKSRVALVPFSQGVRLPTNYALRAARGNPKRTVTVGRGRRAPRYRRTDCMAERMGTQKYTDAAPGRGRYVSTVYNQITSRNRDPKNCTPDSTAIIRPLTNNKRNLKIWVDRLSARGGTAGQIGTAWSWYTLSPNWNSLWHQPANRAVPYDTPETQKIAILMTDGSYNTQYKKLNTENTFTAAGYSGRGTNGSSNSQARAMCTAMKRAGITIYSVGFDLRNGSTPFRTLAHCASDPGKFFDAKNAEELRQSFRAIALKISSLYLSH